MATWTNQRGTATPLPLFARPGRLAPRGAAQDEFELAVTGETEVNPTLLHMLQTEFGCDCDPEELMRRIPEGAIDEPWELEATTVAPRAARQVPGFGV